LSFISRNFAIDSWIIFFYKTYVFWPIVKFFPNFIALSYMLQRDVEIGGAYILNICPNGTCTVWFSPVRSPGTIPKGLLLFLPLIHHGSGQTIQSVDVCMCVCITVSTAMVAFLPRDAMHMRVCLSVCPSVTFMYSVETIRYDSVYLTCSKKLTGSQLSPPHGTNKTLKCETKNKTMSMIGPVQSHCHEGSPVG